MIEGLESDTQIGVFKLEKHRSKMDDAHQGLERREKSIRCHVPRKI